SDQKNGDGVLSPSPPTLIDSSNTSIGRPVVASTGSHLPRSGRSRPGISVRLSSSSTATHRAERAAGDLDPAEVARRQVDGSLDLKRKPISLPPAVIFNGSRRSRPGISVRPSSSSTVTHRAEQAASNSNLAEAARRQVDDSPDPKRKPISLSPVQHPIKRK
ncbi:hypothetical protein ACLOJK_015217, partial [Asimina triloba]